MCQDIVQVHFFLLRRMIFCFVLTWCKNSFKIKVLTTNDLRYLKSLYFKNTNYIFFLIENNSFTTLWDCLSWWCDFSGAAHNLLFLIFAGYPTSKCRPENSSPSFPNEFQSASWKFFSSNLPKIEHDYFPNHCINMNSKKSGEKSLEEIQ